MRPLIKKAFESGILFPVLDTCDNSTNKVFKSLCLALALNDLVGLWSIYNIVKVVMQSLYLIVSTTYRNTKTLSSLMASTSFDHLFAHVRIDGYHIILLFGFRTECWSSMCETILNVEFHAWSIFMMLFTADETNIIILWVYRLVVDVWEPLSSILIGCVIELVLTQCHVQVMGCCSSIIQLAIGLVSVNQEGNLVRRLRPSRDVWQFEVARCLSNPFLLRNGESWLTIWNSDFPGDVARFSSAMHWYRWSSHHFWI